MSDQRSSMELYWPKTEHGDDRRHVVDAIGTLIDD
jgi:hypothetical protein